MKKEILVSSAKVLKSKVFGALHRSFINNKNRSGPRIDPCGTPRLMLLGDELTPLYWAFYVLHGR